ncbi:TetR/AcrR family transcriptional regulator [Actinotalea sp. M2MS4P-6]|uniref:TetR/AcrR family transcriptional regulator n=1 Tax=Actinotalea sp. M2MS4P-6 TaxID=2983762 RepID=UPI0021E36245|nr:TetR/AcrR family transcriptional regulator [Actinotalea sp. M2MS4P-6]MCV2394753.1 TetR/AcrR family transcriptional regulator [Actinotalea sp. M2MS4P-6]
MTETRRRGPYGKTRQRRADIIAAVLEAYATADARGPILRSIAEIAGLSEQAIQHHFPTKDDLFVAVLRDRDVAALAAYEQEPGHPSDELDLISIMRSNEAQPGLVRLYSDMAAAAADSTHPAHEFFLERYEQATLGVARYYARRRSGSDDAEPTEVDTWAARITIAAADGLQTRWLVQSDEPVADDLARLVETIATLLGPDLDTGSGDRPDRP